MTAGKGPRGPGRLRFGISFRWLMILAVCGFALGAGSVALGLVSISGRSDQAFEAWRIYANRTSDKESALREFVTHVGVGAMIDQYESYIMSGDVALEPEIYARAGAALSALDRYRQNEITENEAAALAVLQSVVSRYQANVVEIRTLHREGADAAAIDESVEISDAQAAAAIQTLIERVRVERQALPGEVEPKSEVIFDLRTALGYANLSHAYKNFILRADEVDRGRALASLGQARAAVQRYRAQPLAAEESAALDVIDVTLSAYEAAVVAGLIDELRSGGLEPAMIDRAAAVPMRPLLAALDALDAATAQEERAARRGVTTALNYVASTSKTTATVVVMGALLMIAGSIWLLGFHVAPRIMKMTRVMRALAQGDTQIEIPSTRDRDEIGEASRALLVFRDGIESNMVMARELAESTRLASLGALVAGMAHELNTPIGNALAVASALGESLRHFADEVTSGKLRRTALEDFIRRTSDASSLIERNLLRASQQIGSFKQLAVDQTGDQRRAYKLEGVLKDVVESMRPSVRRARCALTLETEAGLDMDGYPGALTQVVCNLVENSIKHGLADRTDGSVVIAARRIDRETSQVSVSDNGVGIPEDLVPRIFDAFFTTRPGKGGSGLGLHIVNMLVSGPLGGDVSVETKAGAGTQFILTLPNVAPEREPAPEQHAERVYYAAA